MERGCDPPFIRRCGGPVTHVEGEGDRGAGGGGEGQGREGGRGAGRGPLGPAPRVGWLAGNLLEGTQQTRRAASGRSSPAQDFG